MMTPEEIKTDFFCHSSRASITKLLTTPKRTAETRKCAKWLESEIKKEKMQNPANNSSMSLDYWATFYLKRDSSLLNRTMIKTCVPRCDPNVYVLLTKKSIEEWMRQPL